jgi:predicted small secreted protein
MKQQAPLKRRDQRTKSMSKLTLALTLALLVLAGCNTVEGVGEDIAGGARTVGNMIGG